MTRIGPVPSSWLVALQFGLAAGLLLTCWPPAAGALLPVALGLLVIAAGTGIAALAANRPGNFSILPELKPEARLVTTGIYRRIRHPMYSAVLLAMLAAVALDPAAWRVGLWLALYAVLSAKARREERYLVARFPAYAAYRSGTWRFVPWVW